jgi:hypothetical protein
VNRSLVAFAILLAGCAAPASHTGDTSITADLACETARAIVAHRLKRGTDEAPDPAPPGATCRTCNGTGVLGDGASITIKCHACGGTGKNPASVVVSTPPDYPL